MANNNPHPSPKKKKKKVGDANIFSLKVVSRNNPELIFNDFTWFVFNAVTYQ